MPDCLIGGKIVYNLSNNAYAVTSQMILDIIYLYYNRDHQQARFFSACNMAVPAKRFLELGGFNPKFRTSEDREFCDRWHNKGYRMIYSPEAIICHNDYLRSLIGFGRRYFNYGRGAYRFHKTCSLRGSGSLQGVIGFHFTLRNWLFYPFKKEKCGRAIVLAFLLLVWQVSNAAGFLWEAVVFKLNGASSE